MNNRGQTKNARDPSEAANVPWQERFVEAYDGTRLYVRERAGRPGLTIVLCDGIACDGFVWRYLVDDLLPLANVLHWHYRGHGRSGAPVDPTRVDIGVFVDDLSAVLDRCVEGPMLLVGHSMGCQLVLEAFRRRPENIAAIALLCGTSGRLTHTFKGRDALAQTLPRLIERVQRSPRLARALWSNVPPEVSTRLALAMGEVDSSTIEPADILAYSEHVANLDLLMFLRMLHAIGEQTAEDMLPTVNVPALVVAGELDSFTPVHLAEKMAAALPRGELTIVAGATHVVPVERPTLMRDRIQQFLHDHGLIGDEPNEGANSA